AGIGNEYRGEVMFLIGLHPAVPVGRVVEEKVAQALDLARRVMWENRLEPHRVFTGDRRPGMGTFVFGRAAKPCRRCGETIEQSTLGGCFAGGDLVLDAGELERIIWCASTASRAERPNLSSCYLPQVGVEQAVFAG